MSDYDFKSLNDKEFEILCVDLIGEVEGQRIERFKAGRDAGVDGRFFVHGNKEVILQCKHWSGTPITQLLRELTTTEKAKVEKLKPHRYVLGLSNALSRAEKKLLSDAFAPYLSESDIYGKEDLNDLIRAKPHIERKHYKLWLHSTSVLGHIFNNAIHGRSTYALEEIIRSSSRYVVTLNHQFALKILDKLGVVIITGEPGIGKTTLADHLCLAYVADGYSYLKIADEIREAEAVFDADSKQIFYFDDFLGRNYLDALKGHEGSHVTQFIRRVASNKNKKFVLTSRSTILNQGKFLIDNFAHDNVQRNEYEIRISSLTEMDKAQILYNHIWHSSLHRSYVDELYHQRRYRTVIAHQNFNPRLISYITDSNRLEACPPAKYWEYVLESLENPAQIWDHPFNAQQDDFGRAIVFLVVLNGAAIREDDLSNAYHRYTLHPENKHFSGRHEFQVNIRLLTGSFLTRAVTPGHASIDLFNPSIGDYILGTYAGNVIALRLGLLSLMNDASLMTLRSLVSNELLSQLDARNICDALLKHLVNTNFAGTNPSYVSSLCVALHECSNGAERFSTEMQAAILFILNESRRNAPDEAFGVIQDAMEHRIVSAEQALDFASSNIADADSDSALRAMSLLLSSIPEATPGHVEIEKQLSEHVFDLMSDSITDFIDVTAAFSRVDYGDHDAAEKELAKLVENKLSDLGITFGSEEIIRVLEAYDVPYELDQYFENSYDGDDRVSDGPAVLSIDAVDDLFDRS